jgi:hypothetical protein
LIDESLAFAKLSEFEISSNSLKFIEPLKFNEQLQQFPSTRLSLINFLNLVQSNQSDIPEWGLVWRALTFLRDCTLLPPQLVLDKDVDLLPPKIRQEFQYKFYLLDQKLIDLYQPTTISVKPQKPQPASFLSFQGLGEVLFGSANTVDEINKLNESIEFDNSASDDSFSNRNIISSDEHIDDYLVCNFQANEFLYGSILSIYNLPSARWDLGYDSDAELFQDIHPDFGDEYSSIESKSTEIQLSRSKKAQLLSLADIRFFFPRYIQ